MAGLPTGTVTFLFTDLEGSTRLWEEHPGRDAARRWRATTRSCATRSSAHDGVRREDHGRRRPRRVRDRGRRGRRRGRRAARARRRGRGPLPDPLRVRMGIHTGAAELRDGDYYGTAVNRAARLMSARARRPDRGVARDRGARSRDDATVELVDLGEHRLRDLGRPERVFQVAAPGARRGLPAAAVARRVRREPARAAHVVRRPRRRGRRGRRRRCDDARLVTLTGVGGVGKTRLAVQVAAEVLPRFPDGAWLCELAAADDADAMAQVVATTLGVRAAARAVARRTSIVEFLEGPRAAARARQLRAPARRRGRARRRDRAGVPDGARARDEPRGARGRRASRSCALRSLAAPDASTTTATICRHRRGAPVRRSGRATPAPSSRWTTRSRRRSPRSAGGSTGSRSRSSSPRRGSSSMSPTEIAAPPRRAVPAPHRQAPRPRSNATRRCGRRSTGRTRCSSADERAGLRPPRRVRRRASTRRPRTRSRATTSSTAGTSSTRSRAWSRSRCSSPKHRPRRRHPLHDARDAAAVRAGAARRGTATPTGGAAPSPGTRACSLATSAWA